MSILRSALKGMAWFAAGSWLQFLLSLVSFLVVMRHVEPALLGAFNAGAAITAFIDMVAGPSLSLSLGQRASIDRRHINATFWIALAVSLLLVFAIMLSGKTILTLMNAPLGWPLLMTMAFLWPLSILTSVFSSLLSRDLRFSELGRIGMLAGLLGSLVSIATIYAGGGVWALVFGEMTFRLTRFFGSVLALRFRPGPPRDLGAIKDLLTFNLMTLLTLVLTYVDVAAPRLFTSFLLGPAALGYLSLALRCLDLLSQLTLNPLSQVMMVSVARLNRDMEGMRRLIRTVYGIATGLAYPAFIGACILAPNLVWLVGPQWVPAVLSMQIMLVVGLRTATGTFNSGILQGTGRLAGPAAILALGLVMQFLFIPVGARFGPEGVAAAILLRTIGTWPLGCWLVQRASGLSIRDQLRTGRIPLAAGLAMVPAMLGTEWLLHGSAAYLRLAAEIAAGGLTYVLVYLSLGADMRRLVLEILSHLRRGDLAVARARLMAGFSFDRRPAENGTVSAP